MNNRKSIGKLKDGVLLPVAPSLSEVPSGYIDMRNAIIDKIQKNRLRFAIQVNSGMIELYWEIGNEILNRQKNEGWGAKVIDRLSKDLKESFPEMNGFSPRNLGNMKKFAESWPNILILQQVVAKLPWRSNIILMDKLPDEKTRLWYAQKLLENGWSSNVLDMMITARLIERQGKTINNFKRSLPQPDSDLARDIFKDPYLFDYIGTGGQRREIERELDIEILAVSKKEKPLKKRGKK
jgi:predicted nuclease of restriction endonuclease-like (RecB) superfamily